MASSVIKYVKGAVTLFTLCLIGTATAAPNGNGDEKEKEVKAEAVQSTQWFEYMGPDHTSSNYATEALNSENYRLMDESEPSCTTGNTVCAVNVTPDPSNADQPDPSSLAAQSNQILKIDPQDSQIVRFEN